MDRAHLFTHRRHKLLSSLKFSMLPVCVVFIISSPRSHVLRFPDDFKESLSHKGRHAMCNESMITKYHQPSECGKTMGMVWEALKIDFTKRSIKNGSKIFRANTFVASGTKIFQSFKFMKTNSAYCTVEASSQ